MSSVSSALALSQLQIAVAKKQLDAVEQQGKDALALIHAASPAPQTQTQPVNAAPGVGTQLNVVA
jgi:hypothetical protein